MKQFLLLLCISSMSFASINWTLIGKTANGNYITTIEQTLPTNWYTYWKNPGDSGDKASISFITNNVTSTGLEFPKPSILSNDPLITYGYMNFVTYTLPLKTNQKEITARFSWLECADVCIPKEETISLKIPSGYLKLYIPPKKPTIDYNLVLTGKKLQFKLPNTITSAEFFPYENDYLAIQSQSFLNHTLTIKTTNPPPSTVEGELYINHHKEGIIVKKSPMIIKHKFKELALIMIGALIGGLLLNIMPCVLPIIGIKAMQLSKQPTTNKKTTAIAYQIGVSSSLLTLYAGLLILKKFGVSAGWGFQLQSPVMIITLIILFLIFLLSNLDIIIVQAPKFIRNKSSNNMFWSGVLTTFVATPCTAPFLGTALAYALFQPIYVGSIIFIMLSIGLALPITYLIQFPNTTLHIKSGNWNQRIKYGLSFGFVLTIIWLIWILSSQLNPSTFQLFGALMILFLTATFIKKRKIITKKTLLPIMLIMIGSIIVSSLESTSSEWKPYSKKIIKQLETSNSPYFIDVTAKWCITCQTNKINVLNKQKTQTLFANHNITLIKADWTNHDEAITKLLNQHNQISIPTYIYFDGTNYSVISDIITYKTIQRMIEK